MKYFRKDLWEAINSLDFEESERAENEWRLNDRYYWSEYQKLNTRLQKEIFEFFQTTDFHDCKVNECKITQGQLRSAYPTNLYIEVEREGEEWIIEYRKIVHLNINFPEVTSSAHNGFEEWGYDELLPVNDHLLSHEILFSSGSTILVHFFDKEISITKK
ncbi:hypothetical protein RB620_15295 [Paenibacillus sp. LHD-117]|uniref:hypothetical protein n=1 Tax=Paenibacillus sp. LHD-117 TaxID=3071412 RepID=UPI0027E1B25D|nr:hypothetical protein [Paenibacillus sp. LHD-117]MDQ6420794.1 hypothetical protein [Paenibacillus sp. LHD-117]